MRISIAFFLAVSSVFLIAAAAPKPVDLDGDGTPDSIAFECHSNGDEFTVTVNGIRYDGRGESIAGTYAIVDIDSTDGVREIAVPEYGPSDDEATTFLLYRQGKIFKIGKIPWRGDTPHVDGSGIIHTMVRGSILHTWFFPAAFTLSREHTLRMVEQPLYPMGTKCTVRRSFPLRASPTDSTIVATPGAGETFTIVASDNTRWCVVQTSMGTWGWFELDRYDTVLPHRMRADELMDGLSHAD